MADVVTRLVVESKEYDSKIARATSGLTQFEKKCREVGGTLEFVEKEDLAFVQALGQMDTVASTATGKLGELKKAFTELSVQYKNLTDEEKKSPYGQALAGSLEQIKGRIGELGGQLSEVGKEMQTNGSLVDRFADSLGQLGPAGQMAGKLLKGAFGPVGIAIAAVVGVIHQLVEAFKRNENAMASAERAAAPFKAIWQQIQRLFDKMVPVVASGMEKIANIFQSIVDKVTGWIGDLGQTWLGKKLGLDEAYESLKKFREEQKGLAEDNKKIADSENQLNQLRRSTKTANTNRNAQISELRANASDKSTYSADERVGFLEKAMELEKKNLEANITLRKKEYELIKLKNSLTQSGTDDLNAENDALNAITEAQIEYNNQVRAMNRQLQAARNEVEKNAAQGPAMPTETGASFAGPGMSAFEKLQQSIRIKLADQNFEVDQNSLTNLMTVAIQNGIDGLNGAFEGLQYQLAEGLDIPDSAWQELADQINEQLANLGLDPIVLDVTTGGVEAAKEGAKSTADAWQNAVAAVNNVGSALQQIEDPAAKVAGIVMQAVANIALGFAQAVASPATGAAGVFGWIAAATAGLATMVSTIAAVKSATSGSYASGGIIPGNSYSGDNLTANVNSGELILNKAQQGSIASQLTGNNPMQNLQLSTEISGTNLRIVMNNDNRSKGGSRGYYANIH